MSGSTYQRVDTTSDPDELRVADTRRKPTELPLRSGVDTEPEKVGPYPGDDDAESSLPYIPYTDEKGLYQDGTINESPKPLPPPSPTHADWHLPVFFGICMFMHGILVLGYIALIVLRHVLPPDAFQFTARNTHSFIGRAMNQASQQTFFVNLAVKAYMVPLLLITQQLAYRKFLYIKQTLTGLHDKSAAWDGLGASFQALWDYRGVFIGRQRNELRAFRGVSLILLYLGGQWLLNLVAPNLLNIDTTLGNPLDVLMLTENITELVGSDTHLQQLHEALSITNIIPLLNTSNIVTMGLQNSIVYDIPYFNSTSTNTTVNAMVFSTSCQIVSDAKQNSMQDEGEYPLMVDDKLWSFNVTPTWNTLSLNPIYWQANDRAATPGTVIAVSTLPVLAEDPDTNEITQAPMVPITPPLTSFYCPKATCNAGRSLTKSITVSEVQVLGCNIEVTNTTAQVRTSSIPYQVTPAFSWAPSGVWSNWSLPAVPKNPILANISWLGQYNLAPGHTARTYADPVQKNQNWTYTYALLDDSVMQALGYSDSGTKNITLSQLEQTISQAIASIYWRAGLLYLDITMGDTVLNDHDPRATYTLTIDDFAPWISLGASLVMWVVAFTVTIQPASDPYRPHLSRNYDFGVLQLTWLLGQKTDHVARDFQRKVAGNPIPEVLREKGKEITTGFHKRDTYGYNID